MDTIPGASVLGFGFNSLGAYDTSSLSQAVLTPVSGDAGTFTYGGTTYIVPENVSVAQGTGDSTSGGTAFVAQSQQAFQNYFSEKAGLRGSYGGFRGQFDIFFSTEAQSQAMYWYGVVEGDFKAWVVTLQELQLDSSFTSDPDVQALMALDPPTFTPQTQELFFRVFAKWGTHYVNQVTMGGGLDYVAAVETAYSSSEQRIQANLELEYKAIFVDVGATSSTDWQQLGQTWSSERTVTIAATGGDASLLNALDPSYGENFQTSFADWDKSILGYPAIVDFGLQPLSNVFSGALAEAVQQALATYMDQGVYVQADFTSVNGSASSMNGLIDVSGTVLPGPTAPSGMLMGGAQLAVIDGVSLATLVNVGGYAVDGGPSADAVWQTLYDAVNGLTEKSYIVMLSAFGFIGSGYPSAEMATWLAGSGATLQAWRQFSGVYCTDDYNVDYVFVGQQGLDPGQALEKFVADFAAERQPPLSGDFFANLAVGLVPPVSGGPFTLATLAGSALPTATARKTS